MWEFATCTQKSNQTHDKWYIATTDNFKCNETFAENAVAEIEFHLYEDAENKIKTHIYCELITITISFFLL